MPLTTLATPTTRRRRAIPPATRPDPDGNPPPNPCRDCGRPAPPPPRTACDACRDALALANRGAARQAARMAYQSGAVVRRLGLADCMQEAMVALLAAAGRWQPDRSTFATYVHAVVRHHLLEQARHGGVVSLPSKCGRPAARPGSAGRAEAVRRAADGAGPLPPEGAVPDPRPPGAPDVPQAGDEFWEVLLACAALDGRQRLLLHMVHARGWSMAMAGEALGLTRRRARDVYVGALARLRRAAPPPEP